MAANACWGIEIGAYALKALKLVRDGDEVRIVDHALIPHKKVLSTPDIDADEVTRLTIGALVSQYDLSHAEIAVSVPGHMAFARFAKLPPVEPKKIPDIVRFEAVQQIPFPIEEVVWDFQTFVSEASPDVEVGIFAITNERIEDRLHMWGDMGLDPSIVTISPVAVYNAIAYDEIFSETTPGTIILDIGTTSTDLIVAEEGRTWIRTFPLGGHQFTQQLADTFKISYSKAEKLKRETATSPHKRQILQAMRPIFADVVADVQQSIGYYESLHPDANLTRIIGLGSTFQLPGMRKYLSQQLQIDVVRLDDFKRVKLQDGDTARFSQHIHNYVTAYGLGLQGLGEETIRANLMPRQVLRKQMWHEKTKWFAAAAVLSVLASASLFIRPVMDSRVVGNNQSAAEVRDVITLAKSLASEKQKIENENQVGAKAQNVLSLIQGADVWPNIIGDISQALASANPQPELLSGDAEKINSIPVGERRIFWIQSLSAQYIPPAEEKAVSTGRGPGQQNTDQGFQNKYPMIRLSLVVRTTNDRKQNFANDTIVRWFRQHAKRPDVPYYIELDDPRLAPQLKYTEIKPGQNNTPSTPQTGGRIPGGRTGVNPGIRLPGGRTPGGSLPPGGNRGPRKINRTNLDVMALSEPPKPASLAPPDATIHECTIEWTVVLHQPGDNEDQGGDA